MPIVNRIADLHADITAWRHDLHAHPELQYDVHRTAASVEEKLKAFGCDEVARGIIAAMHDLKISVPMVVRLVGTNEEEGRRLLADANLITAESLADAAKKAVAAAQQAGGR